MVRMLCVCVLGKRVGSGKAVLIRDIRDLKKHHSSTNCRIQRPLLKPHPTRPLYNIRHCWSTPSTLSLTSFHSWLQCMSLLTHVFSDLKLSRVWAGQYLDLEEYQGSQAFFWHKMNISFSPIALSWQCLNLSISLPAQTYSICSAQVSFFISLNIAFPGECIHLLSLLCWWLLN